MAPGELAQTRSNDGPRAEASLLLLSARSRVDAEAADRIQALVGGDGLDWDHVVALSRAHGVLPLVHRTLTATAAGSLPGPVRRELRERASAIAAHNVLMTRTLLDILASFDAEGIPAVPFKGPVLAASVYGSTSAREFGDLDILLREPDVLRARDILVAQGFLPEYELSGRRETAYLRAQYEYNLTSPNGVHVELHWHVAARHLHTALDAQHLWGGARQVGLAGTTVLSLAPDDLLIVLGLHGCKHHWQRLTYVCDVAELARANEAMDWERAAAQARAANSGRAVALGILLAHDLLDAPVPDTVVTAARRDRVVSHLASKGAHWVFGAKAGVRGDLARMSFRVGTIDRWRHRLTHPVEVAHVRRGHRLREARTRRLRATTDSASPSASPASPST